MESEKVKEIKKALECCGDGVHLKCQKCPYVEKGCEISLIKDILALINELEATIKLNQKDIDELHKEREKRVEEVYADFMVDYKIMRDELNECFLENERLMNGLKRVSQIICDNTYPYFDKDGKPVNIWKSITGYNAIDDLVKKLIAKEEK